MAVSPISWMSLNLGPQVGGGMQGARLPDSQDNATDGCSVKDSDMASRSASRPPKPQHHAVTKLKLDIPTRRRNRRLNLDKRRSPPLAPPVERRSLADAMEAAELSMATLVEIEIGEKCPPLLDVTPRCARHCPDPASHKAISFHESLRVKESTQGHPETNQLPKRPRLRAYISRECPESG